MSTLPPSATTVAAILCEALQATITTLEGAAAGTILEEQASEHLMLAQTTFDTYKDRLPGSAQHLGRSVRHATGEALGGIALSSVDERMINYTLSDHDQHWNDIGRQYLQYCLAWLESWGSGRPKIFRRRLLTFDAWLEGQPR